MAKWNVHGAVQGSKYIGEVEAETEAKAIEKGWNLGGIYVSVCHQCADELEGPEIYSISVSRADD